MTKEELRSLVPEEQDVFVKERCDNCGELGYGKSWYGHGRATGDAWGNRYEPTGSVVFCKECADDYRIGRDYDGEEIWKTTSDRPENEAIRLAAITKQNTKAIGWNACRAEILKRIEAKEEDNKQNNEQ